MKEKIQQRVERAIKEKVFPGCVIGVVYRNGDRRILPFGRFEYSADSNEVKGNTVYDVASITKTIPLAIAALMFIEKGLLSLEDRVIKYVPEISIADREKGLIRHLLTYTYTLKKNPNPNFSYEHSQVKDIFDFLFKRGFEFLPGTHYKYGNAPAVLLGIVLERVSGKKLYDLTKRMVLEPLKMIHSTFSPKDKKRIPPTEIVSWRGKVQGDVHDETSSILQKAGFDSGCAGFFSNAADILNVAEMMLGGGSFKGEKIFNSKTIECMRVNALGAIGEYSGIGWELNQPRFMGNFSSENMIGRTGFTGTCCLVDVMRGVGVVILSNRTFPKRPNNSEAIDLFRRDIVNIVIDSV